MLVSRRPSDLSGTATAWRDFSRLDEARMQKLLDRRPERQTRGVGEGAEDRCRLANPGDRAGARRSAPRYWIGDRRLGRGR
jgi:MerR family transcriptional regulator, redox-sensitive transcriptional activator SoxR